MLLARSGQPFRIAPALGWATTWALGAAAGVALGGYLTLVSGSGAPGKQALDPTLDLVVLPGVAFGVMLAAHFCGQLIAAVVRGRRSAVPPAEADDRQENDANNRVEG